MQEKQLTKQEEHVLNQARFKKSPEEKQLLKVAKAAWKKTQKK